MRAAIHDVFGEPADVLAAGDAALPQPQSGQVRIKTTYSPIHNHDLWTVRGTYGYKPELPAIGGTEAVGIVDAVGDDVEDVAPGQRVAAAGVSGTWAEFFVAPAAALVPVPDAIDDKSAAQLIAMPFSALSLLEFMNAGQGDWIVQNTANGAVGKTVAMLAAARGIHTVNLVRRDEAVAHLEALGVENAVSTANEGWKDTVRQIVGDAAISAGVDSIGGAASGDILELLGEDGLLVSFGTMNGEPMQLSSGAVIFKQATVKGFWGSKVSAAMPADTRRALIGEIIQLVAAGKLRLQTEAAFAIEDVADAVRASLTAGKSGKILLKP